MTFPVVEATNSSADTSKVTSHSVALPASIAAGDELIVLFSAKGTTFNLPSGWTELYNSGDAFPGLFVIRREADAYELVRRAFNGRRCATIGSDWRPLAVRAWTFRSDSLAAVR